MRRINAERSFSTRFPTPLLVTPGVAPHLARSRAPEHYASRVRDARPTPDNFDSIRQQALHYLDALTGCGLDLGENP